MTARAVRHEVESELLRDEHGVFVGGTEPADVGVAGRAKDELGGQIESSEGRWIIGIGARPVP
jgi:hypothetical protein